MSQLTLICSVGSEASVCQPNGQASEQSLSSNAMPTVKKSSRNIGRASPVIPTSANSTAEASDQSLCLQADFLANHSVSPGSSEARKMTAISGLKCSELFKRQTPIGSLVRTLLASTDWASTIVFLTWKPAATKSRRRLKFQLARSMPDTSETGYGFWQTPTVSSAEHPGQVAWNPEQQLRLPQQVNNPALWPTPRANKMTGTTSPNYGASLLEMARMFPTPTAQDAKNSTLPVSQAHRDSIPGALLADGESGQLNPAFCEWLMGYPIGHTALKDSAIPSSRKSPTKSLKRSNPKSTKPKDETRPF
jgi:hypothetical protein